MSTSRPYATFVWVGPGEHGAHIVDRATKNIVGYVLRTRPGKWRAFIGERDRWDVCVGITRLRSEAAQLVWDNRNRPVENTVSL